MNVFIRYRFFHIYIIEKTGGVAEGHDVEFLLYSEKRPQRARMNIEK
jgi:hypothetical protein